MPLVIGIPYKDLVFSYSNKEQTLATTKYLPKFHLCTRV